MKTGKKEIECWNSIFIAMSLDGYIADKNGGLDWLHSFDNPNETDMGYDKFTSCIDALVMGRNTFATVCHFDIDWPYSKPVFVLSRTLTEIPEKFQEKARLINGNLNDILNKLHNEGYHRLYIDGGKTIQFFLREDRIDEMIITIIPVLLGGGIPLFADLSEKRDFVCSDTKIYLGKIVQNHYIRKR